MASAVHGSAPHDNLAFRIDLLAAEAEYGGMKQAALLLSTMAELLREVTRTETQGSVPVQDVLGERDQEVPGPQ